MPGFVVLVRRRSIEPTAWWMQDGAGCRRMLTL
jgi:hypothetical protein